LYIQCAGEKTTSEEISANKQIKGVEADEADQRLHACILIIMEEIKRSDRLSCSTISARIRTSTWLWVKGGPAPAWARPGRAGLGCAAFYAVGSLIRLTIAAYHDRTKV